MNLNQLAKEIAKREGKKKQTDIAQIKEIIGHLCDIFHEDESCDVINAFHAQGIKRAKKK